MATKFGPPSTTMSSVGTVATTIAGERPFCLSEGRVFASLGFPPIRRSTWPEAFASASAACSSFGGFVSTVHGPSRLFAVIQPSKTRTKSRSFPCRTRSTRVLRTRSSFASFTGCHTGSPSMVTRIADW